MIGAYYNPNWPPVVDVVATLREFVRINREHGPDGKWPNENMTFAAETAANALAEINRLASSNDPRNHLLAILAKYPLGGPR
jgi:hypothetical protein